MAFELITAIVTAVNILITAATAHYTRQQALPHNLKRNVCRELLRLSEALDDIGHAGHDIGSLMRRETFTPGNPDLDKLILLLENQNRNIIRAKSAFESLAAVFKFHAPALSPLIIHLRGKTNRIQLIYSVASARDVKESLRGSLQGWERSKFLRRPEDIIPVVSDSDPYDPVEPFDFTNQRDEDFDLILECIPQLTEFIRLYCPIENLG